MLCFVIQVFVSGLNYNERCYKSGSSGKKAEYCHKLYHE